MLTSKLVRRNDVAIKALQEYKLLCKSHRSEHHHEKHCKGVPDKTVSPVFNLRECYFCKDFSQKEVGGKVGLSFDYKKFTAILLAFRALPYQNIYKQLLALFRC